MIESKEEKRIKAINQAVLQPGKKMPNDGIILQQALMRELEWANEYIVLAVVQDVFQPFVTWQRTIGVEQKADGNYGPIEYCWAGYYYRRLEDAIANFNERSEGALDEREPTSRVASDTE